MKMDREEKRAQGPIIARTMGENIRRTIVSL